MTLQASWNRVTYKAAITIKRHQVTCAIQRKQLTMTENTFILLCFGIHLLPLSEGGRGSRVTKPESSTRRLKGCGIMKVLVLMIAEVCCVTCALCGRGWKALRSHNPQLCFTGPQPDKKIGCCYRKLDAPLVIGFCCWKLPLFTFYLTGCLEGEKVVWNIINVCLV